METETNISRPVLRAINCCVGAQWYSLRKLRLLLEADRHKTKTAQVALAISRRAHRRQDRTIECIPLPQHLAEVELHIEIGFQHLTCAEYFLVLHEEERAQHHLKKFLESLLAAARHTGKPLEQAEVTLIDLQCQLLCRRLRSQVELQQVIRYGSLSAKLTFVLGMHRSGTSLLGRMLCQGGLDAPIDLMPTTERNEKGYWESFGMHLINNECFKQLGVTWHNIDALPLGWENHPKTISWREEVLNHLIKVFPQAPHPMIKDPRFCILLRGLSPWLESDLLELSFLLPIRHPYEVARSLEKAEGVCVASGIRLWLRHVFSAEQVSRGYPRYIVRFEEILSNPEEVMKHCKSVTAQTKENLAVDYSLLIEQRLIHQRVDSVRADIERTTDRIGTERQIASQLFDLLASSEGNDPLTCYAVDDLYCLWQTLD